MEKILSLSHKQQFEEIKKQIATIGAKEHTFIKVEILFFEAITIARAYGDDEHENQLLASFKEIQRSTYQQTKALFKKSSQRERAIRRFIISMKSVLSVSIRKGFATPQLT